MNSILDDGFQRIRPGVPSGHLFLPHLQAQKSIMSSLLWRRIFCNNNDHAEDEVRSQDQEAVWEDMVCQTKSQQQQQQDQCQQRPRTPKLPTWIEIPCGTTHLKEHITPEAQEKNLDTTMRETKESPLRIDTSIDNDEDDFDDLDESEFLGLDDSDIVLRPYCKSFWEEHDTIMTDIQDRVSTFDDCSSYSPTPLWDKPRWMDQHDYDADSEVSTAI